MEATPFNASVKHLPANIQAELAEIVAIIRARCRDSVMIWLFGSYARGDYINDRRIHPDTQLVTEYHSDLDILVLVYNGHKLRKSNIWHNIEHDIEDSPRIQTWVHLISEYLKRFNTALRDSEFFYTDIVKEGIVLYRARDITLAEPVPMTQEKRREFAIGYLDKFYSLSVSKKAMFELAYQRQDYVEAIWNLHQLCERLFETWLLVHTHYKPREHDLFKLRTRIATRTQAILALFPLDTEEHKARLEFLSKAYVDARYLLHPYTVNPDELDKMALGVQAFQRWVLPNCLAFIDGLLPQQHFSATYTPPGAYLDLAELKTTPLPEAVIEVQLKALEKQDKELRQEREDKEKILEEKDKAFQVQERELRLEREAKEQAMEREAVALREKAASEQREKQERKEKEALIEKLKQAGME